MSVAVGQTPVYVWPEAQSVPDGLQMPLYFEAHSVSLLVPLKTLKIKNNKIARMSSPRIATIMMFMESSVPRFSICLFTTELYAAFLFVSAAV